MHRSTRSASEPRRANPRCSKRAAIALPARPRPMTLMRVNIGTAPEGGAVGSAPCSAIGESLDALDRRFQIVLVDLDADEIETELGGGNCAVAEAQKRVEHGARSVGAVQANALLRYFGRK